MSNRLYAWVLAITVLLGVALSAAMIAYTVDAYKHSSIVHYIASERW